eukprot:TRINITY_DN66840_c8_g6_i1.p1 TRINITY_DN66840_c8_g6~~TRINITY_DN66840_c8_g6_i1.p1  ORF type:complete len:498 (+),score=73.10 TRINITY_DN66840_c8_g6_i1:62-1555(+)
MHALGKKSKLQGGAEPEKKRVKITKPYCLFYKHRPQPEMTNVERFETLSLRRLQLLARIYQLDAKYNQRDLIEKVAKDLLPEWEFTDEEDTLSHYALRLAMCESERWRSWFLQYEKILFLARMRALGPADQKKVLAMNDLSAQEVTAPEEKQMLAEAFDGEDSGWYKTPWTLVHNLVEKRLVVVQKGKAFVPQRQLLDVLATFYRAELAKQLNFTRSARAKLVPTEKDRVLAFLDQAVETFTMKSQTQDVTSTGSIDRNQIHALADIHMPLCMQSLDHHLHNDHHLKFQGRWQYGTFLKAIGLSMEDALEFWKTEMTAKASPETWNKCRYAYNIRHYYGKEGKRTSYTSLGCPKIILGPTPNAESKHGCPFRHMDERELRAVLNKPHINPAKVGEKFDVVMTNRITVSSDEVEDILKKSRTGFWQAACHAHFHALHPGAREESLFNSPAQFFHASRRYTEDVKEQQKKAAEAAEEAKRAEHPVAQTTTTYISAGGTA